MLIGEIKTKNNIFLAPMAGYSDKSFRKICMEMGAGLVFSEMVSCKGLFYKDKKTEALMETWENDSLFALQIFGSDTDIMAYTVKEILNRKKEIHIIDINMGCPAPKIVKNNDGSSLMKNLELAGEILYKVKKASEKPVTLKIRKGWDESSVNCIELAKIADEIKIDAVTIHGRTREQYYSGKADWEIIKKVKENVGIPVIANGDIFSPADGKEVLEKTKCDAIMIGRGALGNPWVFKEMEDYINYGKIAAKPGNLEKINMLIKHLEYMIEHKGERNAVMEMRKHGGWYIKGMNKASHLRKQINSAKIKKDFLEILKFS